MEDTINTSPTKPKVINGYVGRKRILVMDVDHLLDAADVEKVDIEFSELKRFLEESGQREYDLSLAIVAIDEKRPTLKDRLVDDLWRAGFIVKTMVGEHQGYTLIRQNNLEMIRQITQKVYKDNYRFITIISGEKGLINLVSMLREDGIQVECVQYENHMDYDLAVKASGFINLSKYIEEEQEDVKQPNEEDDETETEENISKTIKEEE